MLILGFVDILSELNHSQSSSFSDFGISMILRVLVDELKHLSNLGSKHPLKFFLLIRLQDLSQFVVHQTQPSFYSSLLVFLLKIQHQSCDLLT